MRQGKLLWKLFTEFYTALIMYAFIFGLLDSKVEVSSSYEAWDDGVSYFRLQVRSSGLFLDQTITPTGFSGSMGTDWNPIWFKRIG